MSSAACTPRTSCSKFLLTVGAVLITSGSPTMALLTTEPWMPILDYGLIGFGAMVHAWAPG